jgi:hypothetical protein
MLDQCEVSLVQRIFLSLVSTIQGYFLAIVNEPRVLEPKFALQPCLVCDIFAEWWCQSAHNVRGDLDEERHEEETFTSNTS